MQCFSYVVVRDFGFAPNPFGAYCTLATCKPEIRKRASIGDIVVGTGSRKNNEQHNLIYVMYVEEKMDFNSYWNDKRFQNKKPILNGSLKQMYGDNIYYFDTMQNKWIQVNSHHSNPDGSPNLYNMDRDLKSNSVLVSKRFWYFGGNSIVLPQEFKQICQDGRGYKRNFPQALVEEFHAWISDNYSVGYHGKPHLFTSFQRYDGVS